MCNWAVSVTGTFLLFRKLLSSRTSILLSPHVTAKSLLISTACSDDIKCSIDGSTRRNIVSVLPRLPKAVILTSALLDQILCSDKWLSLWQRVVLWVLVLVWPLC